ncbi:MAG: geranylgeranylglyceryl/heptaprenylglyceryl phosphate synthase [Candidatus Aenigmarchaeota archaeon]|nr:geranylgeranylglyceryl/heptaprenylglyceryl phosphate synthase [Candidatus Aenigmarchaeota archaeon]
MKSGKVENYISDKIEKEGALLLSLLDPAKRAIEQPGKIARAAEEAGADIILVGGSIGAQGQSLDELVKALKENSSLPVVLFPGNIFTYSKYADAVYFMTLINARDVYWNSTVQIMGAGEAKKAGLESIPTGYVILEPGMTVGWISNANLVPRSRPDLAAATALAGEYMGARLIITDSGSGAPEPAPLELIAAVKSVLTVPYFYAGGVKTPEQAYSTIKAGADGIHVGTAIETGNSENKLKALAQAVKKAGKEKI